MLMNRAILFSLVLVVPSAAVPVAARADEAPPEGAWKNVHRLFTWNHGLDGVYPTFEVDVGRKNTVGAAGFARDLLLPQNQLRLAVAIGTGGLVDAHALDRLELAASDSAVYVRGQYRRRPDEVFYGMGGDTRSADKTFFLMEEPRVAVGLERGLLQVLKARAELLYQHTAFGPGDADGAPSLDQRFGGGGQPPFPPGWDGYGLIQGRAAVAVDSRGGAATGSGVGLGLDGAYNFDPGDTATRFISWGVVGTALLDASGAGHLLGLELVTRFTENTGSNEVPFLERASLGGRDLMRGFLAGRLRGDSALCGTLFYQQPIGRWVEGELFLSLGNVFDGRLRGLDYKNLYANYGVRLETRFSRQVSVGLLAGWGSTRFGAPDIDLVDDVRFNLGVNHSF
jgi:hypothetical protein